MREICPFFLFFSTVPLLISFVSTIMLSPQFQKETTLPWFALLQ